MAKQKFHKKTYDAWWAMRRRCNDPTFSRYNDWGGRGITCDQSWNDFYVFLTDMGEAPEGHSLDRRDNDGPYNKENCRWTTRSQQAINTRVRSDNSSGTTGVHFIPYRNKWMARISIDGKRIHLGDFSTKEEAIAARLQAKAVLVKDIY